MKHEHAPGVHHEKPRRFRPRFHYELLICGVRGHELVGLDAREIGPDDALVARQVGDVRWHRCLRCDSWLPVNPREPATRDRPPAREEIVLPLRGKPLRDKIILRLIAVNRGFHFLVLGALGTLVLVFAHDRGSAARHVLQGRDRPPGRRHVGQAALRRPRDPAPDRQRVHDVLVEPAPARGRAADLRDRRRRRDGRPVAAAPVGRVPDVPRHDIAAAARDLRDRRGRDGVQGLRARRQRGHRRLPAVRQATVRLPRRLRGRGGAEGARPGLGRA